MTLGGTKTPRGRKAGELVTVFPLMLLMCMSMVYPFVAALDFGLSFLTVLLTVSLCLAFWTAVLYNWKTMLCALALAVVGAVVIVALFSSRSGAVKLAGLKENVNSFLYWTGMYLKGFRSTNLPYAALLVAIFAAAISLVVCLFTFKQFDLITVLLSGAACYVALVVIGHVVNLPALFCYIFAASLYIMLSNYKKNLQNMPGGKAPALPAYMASALPLAAIVLISTIFLSGYLKIDPAWMKDIREKLLKKSNPVSLQAPQNMAKQTFSSDELGGDVSLTDEIVMEVVSPVGNVHLRAMSKDYYSGHSWARSDKDIREFDPALLTDTDETASIFTGDAETLQALFPPVELSVQYDGYDTGIIYAPLKLNNLEMEPRVNIVGGDMLMLQDGNGYNLSYKLQYYQPQYGEAAFLNFARNPKGYPTLRNKAYDEMNALIRRQYTQLPDVVPQRVRELARQLTEDKDNDFDKAAAIESYLKGNFAYTLTPGGCDPNRDFVDQFLFEGKKGYCTYYASAMAVMLRCVGIPARYAEGYILPGSVNEDGAYEVTKKQGHAWAEVYFDDLGWLTFEPTSSFSGQAGQTGASVDHATPKPTVRPLPTLRPEQDTAAAPTEEEPGLEAEAILIPAVLLVLLALLFFLIAVPNRARAALRKMEPREASIHLFNQYLRLLDAQGAAPVNGEDLSLYAKKLDSLYGLERPGFGSTVEIFHLARFSEHKITYKQRHRMLAVREELLKASKKKLGFFKYIYFKYIWGI